MQPDHGHPRTHLFLVRLWVEPFANDQCEVRMQVKYALGGESRYFREWKEVVAFMLAKVEKGGADCRWMGGE